MSIQALEVGAPYPSRLPQESGEGLWPHLVQGGFNLVFLSPQLQGGDMNAFSRTMQVGVIVQEDILFVTVVFKRWGVVDGHVNPFQYNESHRGRYIDALREGNVWTFVATETRDRIVRHLRQIGVSNEIQATSYEGLQASLDAYDDASDVERAARRVYHTFSRPDDLAEICTAKQVYRR